MLTDVTGPHAGVALLDEALANEVDDAVEEGAGAGGGIEDQDTVALGRFADWSVPLTTLAGSVLRTVTLEVSARPSGRLKRVFEQVIDRADDVGDDRLGGEIDAARFTQFGS